SSLQYFDDNPLLNGRTMSTIWKMYLGGFNGTLPSYYAVPSLARDLAGLPPTYIIACEYDPLRDESIEYARRLLSFSVQTQLVVIPGVPHGYDLIHSELTEWSVQGISIALNKHFRIIS
ncbi:MAG: alpha/beta hydrolase, partial [Clostridiales bacterium]|nr:alpha/beta hydrolase [Clostridiales bacterium]